MKTTSIILVTHNQLAATQACIRSIRRHTPPSAYEIIAVDNASTDGTAEWLSQQPDVRLIANTHNAGFPGTAAAVLLRCILTMGAIALLRIPFLQTAGALLLLLIAYKLVAEREEGETHAPGASSLSGAVWTIVTADFVMSLDNVLAVTAVSGGDIPLLLIGIVMSIPIIIWGSSFFMRLMDKAPWLVYAGGALLAYTAGKMVLHDDGLAMWLPQLQAGRISEALPWLLASALLMAALVMRWRSAPRKPD